MYAASREAIAQTRAALGAALNEESAPAAASQTGTELFAVVSTIDAERQLRMALTDSSVPAAARDELAQRLFTGKVGAAALATVRAAASQTWSRTSDFADSLVELGYEALLRAAGARLDTVEDQLFRLSRIIADDSALEQAFSDRSTSAEAKAALMKQLVDGKVDAVTLALAGQAARRPQTSVVPELAELSDLAARQRSRSVAHVRSAAPLSDTVRAQLAQSLQRSYGRAVDVHVEVDPALLSGLVVRIGDDVIDGSAAGRLAELRQAFK